MPRVYLSDYERQLAAERRQNDVIALAVRTNKGRNGLTDQELAEQCGRSRCAISRYKRPEGVAVATFENVRRLAHAVKMTPEEWLKAGGFA